MRDFSKVKRVVVKIGTNTLSRDGRADTGYIGRKILPCVTIQIR